MIRKTQFRRKGNKSLKMGGQQSRTKKNMYPNKMKSKIVQKFMELLTMIKLYHWKTQSFSQHKATDELYAKLNENIDQFVEILLGKSKKRVHMLEKHMRMYDLESKTELREHIFECRLFLTDMNRMFDSSKDSDLLNIRDEILGDLNQFLYLLTFDKP
jgi:DNA-binding ferritin-like protein